MRNKPNNFFKYALTEILLVVIGILIAVSINNWNQHRKQKKELKSILAVVEKDIKNDIEEVNKILTTYAKADSLFLKVINSQLTKEDYLQNPRIGFLIMGYPEISFNQRGIHLLENFKSESNLLSEGVVNEVIEFYTERMLEIKVDEELREDDFKNNFEYWKNRTEWWADYLNKKDITQFVDYALNSQDYKNRVATFHFLTYDVYLPELKLFKEKGQKIIKQINENE